MANEPKDYRKAISVVIKKGSEYLITNTKGWDEKVWCFVQGGIENGEKEEDAVLREIREEIGDVKVKIKKRWPKVHRYNFSEELANKKGFKGQEQSVWFVDFLGDPNDIEVSDGDLEKVKWVKKEEIMDYFAFPEQKEFFKEVLGIKKVVL